MKYFKSLGTGGWKSAILKIKMNKKKPAFTVGLLALPLMTTNNGLWCCLDRHITGCFS